MPTFYVSTSGNDSNLGTITSPWRTIQKAANTATAGSTVNVRGGTYAELIEVTVSGSAGGGFITFQSYTGETAIIDGTSFSPFTSGSEHDVILMEDRSYLRWQGFEIRNFNTATQNVEINGILVMGTSHHIEIIGNKIHDIRINVTQTSGGNGHGILCIGTNGTTAMTDIVIDSNEVYNLRTGFSECITVNGNVNNWRVTNNVVHDCNNIAIDAAGHYGVCPNAANDQARNGIISGNRVTDIDSSHNPAYGGNFVTGGGGHSADGLYVDGGTNIIIERNIVVRANIGIEMASEHAGKSTSYITVRDNVVVESYTFGITIGGYDTDRGSTENCKILNNTLLNNGTSGESEIEFQFDTRNNVVKNNVIYGNGLGYFIHNGYTQNTGNVVDYNLYFGPGGSGAALFAWKNVGYTGFTAYKSGSGNDAHSIYADPKFINAGALNLQLQVTSPAIGVGDNNVISGGELDLAGAARIAGALVDMGAYEYLLPGTGVEDGPITLSEALALAEGIGVASTTSGAVVLAETVALSEGIGILSEAPETPVEPPDPAAIAVVIGEPVLWGESLVARGSFGPRPGSLNPRLIQRAFPGPRVTNYDRLGGGVVRPFRRASHGDFGSDQGVPSVLSNIGQILGTAKGTLPWRPRFGSDLERLRHRPNTPALRDLAIIYAREALGLWDSRVKLTTLSVSAEGPERNQLLLRATVNVLGEEGQKPFAATFGHPVAGTTVATPLNYTNIGRIARVQTDVAPPPQLDEPQRLTFLSTGLVRPVRRAADFLSASGVAEILSNVGEVLGTAKGTIPWRPTFGSDLHRLRHRNNNESLRALAAVYVRDALKLWEPRAQASKVEVLRSAKVDDNTVIIRVTCKLMLGRLGQDQVVDVAVN